MTTATSDMTHFKPFDSIPRVKRSSAASKAYLKIREKNAGGILIESSEQSSYYLPATFLHRFVTHVARTRGADVAGSMTVGKYLDLYFTLNDGLARSFRAELTQQDWEPVLVSNSILQATANVDKYVSGINRSYEVFAVREGTQQVGWFLNHESLTHTPPPGWFCENNHENDDFDSGNCSEPLCGKKLKV